jgi:glycogen operon protein
MLGSFTTRLSGSADLYEHSGRPPYCSINFITSHDGFTLNDLVTYREKRNEANGERNRDGENNNHSDNYGVEGPTNRVVVNQMRARQIRNMLTTLMLSQGVPMISAGDECRRTQQGNNNAYCQDNPISWFDWQLVDKNADLLRFCRGLIHFRRQQPTVRRDHFLTGRPNGNGMPDVSWFSALGTAVDWQGKDATLICLLTAPDVFDDPDHIARDVLLLVNASGQPREFILPPIAKTVEWRMFVDTSAEPPLDIFPEQDGPPPPSSGRMTLCYRSLRCYVASSPTIAKR